MPCRPLIGSTPRVTQPVAWEKKPMATSVLPQEQTVVGGNPAADFQDDPVQSIEDHGLDAVIAAVESLPEAKQPKPRQSNLDALAAKVAKAGKEYQLFLKDEKAFEKASEAFAEVEDKWFKRRDSFKAFLFKNAKDILALRAEFPSIKNPGSSERLSLNGKAWSWAEFVKAHFGVEIQTFNKAMKEFAHADIEALDRTQAEAQKALADVDARRNKGGGSKPRSGWKAADAKTAKMAARGRSSAAASSTPFVAGQPKPEPEVQGVAAAANHQTVVNWLKAQCGGEESDRLT